MPLVGGHTVHLPTATSFRLHVAFALGARTAPPLRSYYVSSEQVLRTHTSAHQSALMREGKEAFLCTGDVDRRDEIDASHFPAFHQARTRALDARRTGSANVV